MQQSTSFSGDVFGRNIIAGSSFASGATMINNFGPYAQGKQKNRPARALLDRPVRPGPRLRRSTRDPRLGARQVRATGRARGAGRPRRGRASRRPSSHRSRTPRLTTRSKSQLAIQHAHNVFNTEPQPFVFWVHVSTRARFEEAYRAIADKLELPGRDDPKTDVLQLVSRWLGDGRHGRWTMVLDNVDDIEIFFPSSQRSSGQGQQDSLPVPLAVYVPQSNNGSVLITSRSREAAARLAGGHNRTKDVPVMKEGQGLQLLRNKLLDGKQDRAGKGEMLELVHALDYIPLAITQAAAYVNRQARLSIADYLREFRASDQKRESLLHHDAGDLQRDESASNSVVVTWQMSFEQIRRERTSAADLLSLMSFFNPQRIPEGVLRRHGKVKDSFDEDLNTLHAYSLISIAVDDETCGMHALVQFCTQVWLLSFGNKEQWRNQFVELMAVEFPKGEFENWAKCEQLLPHIETLLHAELSTEEIRKAQAQVLTNAAEYIWRKGRYDEAETLNRRALEWKEKELGKQHPYTLASVNNLAMVLRDQGKYDEAETLLQRALEGMEKELGKQHPDTLISVNNLAMVLLDQGKYDKAESLHRQALEGIERELGKQHPDTLASINNLAIALNIQGKYDEAETLFWRALEGSERELGKQHPDTLTSINNLAMMLLGQGKYNEAETLHRQALERRERELGKQHPYTLTSINNLAIVLLGQGKYDEAETLFWRALEGIKKELGKQHPHTLTCHNNLLALQQKRKHAPLATNPSSSRRCDGAAISSGSAQERKDPSIGR